MKQRTPEWRDWRAGKATASNFGKVLSSPSIANVFRVVGNRGDWSVLCEGEIVDEGFARKADAEDRKKELAEHWRRTHWSNTAWEYAATILAERWTGQPAINFTSPATDWGEENEPAAFEAAVPVIAERFGQRLILPEDEFAFLEHPTEPDIGCSPDGVIGDDGLCEIKCPYNSTKWVQRKLAGLTVPNEYIPQLQGSLWVTGRQWYAFVYYDGRMEYAGFDPLLITRVERDDNYIDHVLAPRVLAFRDWVNELDKEHRKLKEPF